MFLAFLRPKIYLVPPESAWSGGNWYSKDHFSGMPKLEIDLAGTGDLYSFVPLKLFASLTRLRISSTAVTNRHFQQIIYKASDLEYLDISNCPLLDQSSIFHGKNALSRLEYVNISGNCGKFTILAVACLCSCENITTVVAHGYNFSPDECCFFQKHLTLWQEVLWSWRQKMDSTPCLCFGHLKRTCMKIFFFNQFCLYVRYWREMFFRILSLLVVRSLWPLVLALLWSKRLTNLTEMENLEELKVVYCIDMKYEMFCLSCNL